jgi:hypothetical protein
MGTKNRQVRKGELYNTGRQCKAGRQFKATNGRQVKQIRQESYRGKENQGKHERQTGK